MKCPAKKIISTNHFIELKKPDLISVIFPVLKHCLEHEFLLLTCCYVSLIAAIDIQFVGGGLNHKHMRVYCYTASRLIDSVVQSCICN